MDGIDKRRSIENNVAWRARAQRIIALRYEACLASAAASGIAAHQHGNAFALHAGACASRISSTARPWRTIIGKSGNIMINRRK